jgi:uncharacterized protein
MAPVFIDANIFLRHLLQDEPAQSPRATRFVSRLELRQIHGETSVAVIAEVIFVLERTYKLPKTEVRLAVLELLELPGLTVLESTTVRDALNLYAERNISYTDAFNVVLMRRRGLTEVVSFDHDFDRIEGITRVEP